MTITVVRTPALTTESNFRPSVLCLVSLLKIKLSWAFQNTDFIIWCKNDTNSSIVCSSLYLFSFTNRKQISRCERKLESVNKLQQHTSAVFLNITTDKTKPEKVVSRLQTGFKSEMSPSPLTFGHRITALQKASLLQHGEKWKISSSTHSVCVHRRIRSTFRRQ